MAKEAKWVKQTRKPRQKTQFHNRCRICGRPRGFIRYFGICRLCFRKLALNQELPGVTKASW